MEKNMTCDYVNQKLNDGALLLDVRSEREFDAGRLDGSFNVPLEKLEMISRNMDKNKEVLLYCRSGVRSQMATDYLRSLGFSAENIGGINQFIGCLDY